MPSGQRKGINPESALGKRLAKRTEGNLRADAKAFRDKFVTEYLVDFSAINAYRRAGGGEEGKAARNRAYELTQEPYVAQQIRKCIDDADEKTLVTRKRILAGLVREANRDEPGSQHGARVSAWSKLAGIMGMDVKRVEASVGVRAGVLIVPATEDGETWEKRAAAMQQALRDAVRT